VAPAEQQQVEPLLVAQVERTPRLVGKVSAVVELIDGVQQRVFLDGPAKVGGEPHVRDVTCSRVRATRSAK